MKLNHITIMRIILKLMLNSMYSLVIFKYDFKKEKFNND